MVNNCANLALDTHTICTHKVKKMQEIKMINPITYTYNRDEIKMFK